MCKSSNKDDQPLDSMKKKHPFLHWRRKGGRECALCPYFKDQDEQYINMTKDELAEHLQENVNQLAFNEDTWHTLPSGTRAEANLLGAHSLVLWPCKGDAHAPQGHAFFRLPLANQAVQ